MARSGCVIDASALVLAVQREERDARAALARKLLPRLLEAHGLTAPALLAWELGQIVHRKRPTEWRDRAHRSRTLQLLLEDIELAPPDAAMLERTGHIAEAHDLSFHDAAYLELAAGAEDRFLLTEDERLLSAGRALLGPERTFDLGRLDAKIP